MFNVRLALEMAVHLADAGDIFLIASYFVLSFFFLEVSWMRCGTELRQFLRTFLPTFGRKIC